MLLLLRRRKKKGHKDGDSSSDSEDDEGKVPKGRLRPEDAAKAARKAAAVEKHKAVIQGVDEQVGGGGMGKGRIDWGLGLRGGVTG